jgi:O-antigen/teichoic acid export membrane protein
MSNSLNKFNQDINSILFIKVALARLLVAGSGILLVIYVGRVYGVAALGLFTIAQSFVITISVFSRRGLDVALTKIAAITSIENTKRMSFIWAFKKVFLISGLLSLLFFCFSHLIAGLYNRSELYDWLLFGALASIPFSLLGIYAGYLKGLKRPVLASFFENNGVCLLILLFIFPFWYLEIKTSSILIMFLFTICSWLLLCLAIWCLRLPSFKKNELEINNSSHARILDLSTISKSTFYISLAAFIQSSLIILYCGTVLSNEDLGLLRASQQIGFTISFLLMVANTILPPRFAILYSERDYSSLVQFVKRIFLISGFIVFIPVAICIFFPEWVLSWFGPDFVQGAFLLRIITIGHFINVIFGCTASLLVMTGSEKKMRQISLGCSVFGFLSCVILVNIFGVVGAAISISLVLLIQNFLCILAVRNKFAF